MMPSPQFMVYLVGVGLAGWFYEPIKSALGGQWLFLVCIIGYAVALRLLGAVLANAFAARRRGHDA